MERYTIYPKDVYKGALILVNQEHPERVCRENVESKSYNRTV